MDYKRYVKLNREEEPVLTDEEVSQGWHFCYDWDYLLVGPGTAEIESCNCTFDQLEPKVSS